MATFSKAAFDTLKYASARPTYPRQLFDLIFRYHELGTAALRSYPAAESDHGQPSPTKARWDAAVDLGCGTGQATVELHPFKHVIGVDPSDNMLGGARNYIISVVSAGETSSGEARPGSISTGQFEFVQSKSEALPFIEHASIDLVVSAQAAHWFDWKQLWPELARIVRSGGSVAFWGYSEFRLTHYPALTPLINAYSQGSDPATSLGPHWEQPGRSILDNHLLAVPNGSDVVPGAFLEEERVYFTGPHAPSLPKDCKRPVILRKRCTWADFEAYLQSFSSLHTFRERHQEDAQRPGGDIVTRFLRDLKEGMRQSGTDEQQEFVHIEWPLALVLAKRI